MKELEQKIDKYLKERGWDKLRPSDLSKSLMIEGAELLELFQWDNLSVDEVKKDEEKMREIKKELADIFMYAFEMSVILGFDTKKIIEDKLELITKKYPADLVRLEPDRKNESPAGKEYWRIKKEHRANGN